MSEEAGNIDAPIEPIVSDDIGSDNVGDAVIEDSGLAVEGDGAEVDALAADLENAIDNGESDEVIQDMIRSYKIKVNGEEKNVDIDFNNEADIIRRLQMAEAGQAAMQKSAELERNFESELNSLVDDPIAMLEQLGIDVDKLMEDRIEDRITQLKKSPEQLAKDAQDQELTELRKRIKDEEEKRADVEFQQLQAQATSDLDQDITEALSSTAELPKSPYVVKRMADALLLAINNGHEDVTAKDVLPWVQKEINEEMKELMSAMPDKVLENYLGSQTLDRLRKNRLAKMSAPKASDIKETGTKVPEIKENKKKIKMSDWLRHGSSLKDL